jgi:hypothetical protein
MRGSRGEFLQVGHVGGRRAPPLTRVAGSSGPPKPQAACISTCSPPRCIRYSHCPKNCPDSAWEVGGGVVFPRTNSPHACCLVISALTVLFAVGAAAAEYSKAAVTEGATRSMRWVMHASTVTSENIQDALLYIQHRSSRLLSRQKARGGSLLQRASAISKAWLEGLRSRENTPASKLHPPAAVNPHDDSTFQLPPSWLTTAKHMREQLRKFGEQRMHALKSVPKALASGYTTPAASTVFVDTKSSPSRQAVATGAPAQMVSHRDAAEVLAAVPCTPPAAQKSKLTTEVCDKESPPAPVTTAKGSTPRRSWWESWGMHAKNSRNADKSKEASIEGEGAEMERAGFERDLQGVRAAEGVWERLTVARMALRVAVDALGRDVAEVVKVLEVLQARDSDLHERAAHGGSGGTCLPAPRPVQEVC